MAKRRSRIAYAPKSRRKTSGTDRVQSDSTSVQEIKEKEERNQPRRRNRVAYVPNSRRKSSASRSDANDSSSSNVQKTEEKQKRNKRRANDSVSTSLKSGHQQPKVNKLIIKLGSY